MAQCQFQQRSCVPGDCIAHSDFEVPQVPEHTPRLLGFTPLHINTQKVHAKSSRFIQNQEDLHEFKKILYLFTLRLQDQYIYIYIDIDIFVFISQYC